MNIFSNYNTEISDLAYNNEDKLFYTSKLRHAAIVEQIIAQYTHEYIYIFGDINNDKLFNDKYADYIRDFLDFRSTNKINIITTDNNKSIANIYLINIFLRHPYQVSIKQYNGEIIYKEHPAYFTISDGKSFRLETDTNKYMSFGNFNSPTQAKQLQNVFEKNISFKIS